MQGRLSSLRVVTGPGDAASCPACLLEAEGLYAYRATTEKGELVAAVDLGRVGAGVLIPPAETMAESALWPLLECNSPSLTAATSPERSNWSVSLPAGLTLSILSPAVRLWGHVGRFVRQCADGMQQVRGNGEASHFH